MTDLPQQPIEMILLRQLAEHLAIPVWVIDGQGDLVFFNGLGHMGMYIGGGQFIHAPHTGDVVKISSLNESWYASTFVGARRIL